MNDSQTKSTEKIIDATNESISCMQIHFKTYTYLSNPFILPYSYLRAPTAVLSWVLFSRCDIDARVLVLENYLSTDLEDEVDPLDFVEENEADPLDSVEEDEADPLDFVEDEAETLDFVEDEADPLDLVLAAHMKGDVARPVAVVEAPSPPEGP